MPCFTHRRTTDVGRLWGMADGASKRGVDEVAYLRRSHLPTHLDARHQLPPATSSTARRHYRLVTTPIPATNGRLQARN